MTRFAVEPLDRVLPELKPLVERHGEVSPVLGIPADPAYDVYLLGNRSGIMRCYTARDVDGALVGYCTLWFSMSSQARTILLAQGDALWLDPAARRPRVAWRFLDFIENDIRSLGVKMVQINARPDTPLQRLLAARGYDMIATTFGRVL